MVPGTLTHLKWSLLHVNRLKMHENAKVSQLLQKLSNQNGGIIWSITGFCRTITID